jgi:hypothetical protein
MGEVGCFGMRSDGDEVCLRWAAEGFATTGKSTGNSRKLRANKLGGVWLWGYRGLAGDLYIYFANVQGLVCAF